MNKELEIVVIGSSNSGKSTIVQLIQDYLSLTDDIDLNIVLDKNSQTYKEGPFFPHPELMERVKSLRESGLKITIRDEQKQLRGTL